MASPPPARRSKRPTAGGGFPALWYTLKKARQTGGFLRMYRALSARNACKTCALGMGGQSGGMVNEAGDFPEVCKKSVQAMAADMQGRIRPGYFDEFSFAHLERFTPRELEHAGRLTTPLYAGPNDRSYREIEWSEAIQRVGGALKAGPAENTFFYFSGRSSNEAGFLLQLFARLYGTNNVNNCSFFCHQASGVGLASVTGSGTATVSLEDVAGCDLLFLIGGNPASNHPRFMRSLMDLKRRHGRVIVINPLRELGLVRFKVPSDPLSLLVGTNISDLYLQSHIGGDIAALAGIAKATLESGRIDEEFIAQHTEGAAAWRESLDSLSWERIERESGVSRAELELAATMYAESERTIFAWTMGITHHSHGVQNVQAIANLAMLRGMLGQQGAGLLPLRGHSNVQGIGSMGAVPELRGNVLKAIEDRLGVTLPRSPGLDTLACVSRANEGNVRFALHLGGNLFGSCPDATYARTALHKIGLTVFLSTTLNTGHVHGRGRESLILPVLARDEEPQPTTQESMFNYVRLSEGGTPRHVGPKTEVDVICDLAQDVLANSTPLNFAELRRHDAIRQFIAQTIPGYGAIGEIDRTKREFHVEGRVFHEPRFRTENGKARFHNVAPPSFPTPTHDALRLMTIRSEGQFNTVVYEEEDIYRGQERRDVILMNQEDIRRLRLTVNEAVTVRSATGEMRNILVRAAEIRAGNAAMYYPEANVLVPREIDPASRTPSFKHISITIEKTPRLTVLR